MARVRALAQMFDGVGLREAGEEFDFDGAPAAHIEFLNKDEEKAAAVKHRETSVEARKAQVEAEVRAQLEAKYRAEIELNLRAEVEAEVRAKLKAAGKDDAASLV